MFDPSTWTLENLRRHSVDLRQFIDFRESTLPNGTRIVEAYNSSGLTFTVLPDRGLDIWTAHFNGVPLTWISQGSPYAPDAGQRWLEQFNGGLLTTCGLTHAGQPETDDQTGEWRELHGRYSRLRATDVAVERNDTQISLRGTVAESALYGDQFRLQRRYTLTIGQPTIAIHDTVTNVGDTPSPFMLLYHLNVGYPLVGAGGRLYPPAAMTRPLNPDAPENDMATWPDYFAAEPGYVSQVFAHHLKESGGYTETVFAREQLGLSLRWKVDTIPYLTQWKNTRQGIYVCGIEPGNCVPEGQNSARRSGRLVMLQPGETHAFEISVTVLSGAEAINAARQRVDALQTGGTPIAGCKL
ncbi:MAG: aldose 1-epimerase family protein [Anaerolineae bacterium]|nr:aldose 1-epimerase family protein [Anaerolineae bacterium]